jgi:hypothetical protein
VTPAYVPFVYPDPGVIVLNRGATVNPLTFTVPPVGSNDTDVGRLGADSSKTAPNVDTFVYTYARVSDTPAPSIFARVGAAVGPVTPISRHAAGQGPAPVDASARLVFLGISDGVV